MEYIRADINEPYSRLRMGLVAVIGPIIPGLPLLGWIGDQGWDDLGKFLLALYFVWFVLVMVWVVYPRSTNTVAWRASRILDGMILDESQKLRRRLDQDEVMQLWEKAQSIATDEFERGRHWPR
jgi:hypothetical protein